MRLERESSGVAKAGLATGIVGSTHEKWKCQTGTIL